MLDTSGVRGGGDSGDGHASASGLSRQHAAHRPAKRPRLYQWLFPTWIPARAIIDYLTGAFLIVGGICFLVVRKTRVAATYLGTWILFLVVVYYGPMLIGALANPNAGAQLEGLNYFADTLLFGATILSLATIDGRVSAA